MGVRTSELISLDVLLSAASPMRWLPYERCVVVATGGHCEAMGADAGAREERNREPEASSRD